MFSFLLSVISAFSGFLYPAYSSFKTLSRRPLNESELERWTMYWSVLAALLTIEQVLPLIFFFIPFYTSFRTLFLLYLVLPQVQGSSYVYAGWMRPWLEEHEDEIDGLVDRGKGFLWREIGQWGGKAWEAIVASVGGSQTQAQAQAQGYDAGAGPIPVPPDHPLNAAPPPSLASPLSGSAQVIGGLWKAYGPSVIAAGTAAMQRAAPYARPTSGEETQAPVVPSSSTTAYEIPNTGGDTSTARRRALDAELAFTSPPRPASLSQQGAPAPGGPAFPIPQPYLSTSASSYTHPQNPSPSPSGSSDERERRFESIERDEADEMPTPQRQTSWFAGWGGSPAGKGYERVKSE